MYNTKPINYYCLADTTVAFVVRFTVPDGFDGLTRPELQGGKLRYIFSFRVFRTYICYRWEHSRNEIMRIIPPDLTSRLDSEKNDAFISNLSVEEEGDGWMELEL